MNILVLNAGSSSLKFQLINPKQNTIFFKGIVDGIGLKSCEIRLDGATVKKQIKTHQQALEYVFNHVDLNNIDLVAHRVVHGGEYFDKATTITPSVIKKIEFLSDLAPLHNPPNLAGIKAVKKLLPKIKQVAVFDTAFHQTLPKHAYLYGIPYEYYKKYGIRKYGFHGTSHKYITDQAKKLLKKKSINIISCHLGNGSSITAIKQNKSIDTSMGFSPLQGLLMGTRSGDLDPVIVAYLEKKEHLTPQQLEMLLNKKSGLLGVSGSSDMRIVHKKSKTDKRSKLAIDMLCYDILKYIGSYMAVLGKVDAITFTAGLGEQAWYIRQQVCDQLAALGVKIDKKKNKENKTIISSPSSKIKVFVIPANEELQIAKEAATIVKTK